MKKSIILITVLCIMNSMCSCAKESTANQVPPKEFAELIETKTDVKLLDVRTPEEFAEGYIPGALNIDISAPDFVEKVKATFPTGSEIAVYCRSGRRSAEAAKTLEAEGYACTDLQGGILDWEKAGLTVTTGPEDIYFTEDGKKITIQPLIHASLRINYDGKEIEVDPVGKMGDRTTDYASFPKADIILVTHEHYDHLDPESIKTLSKADTVFITNQRSADIAGWGKVMKNGDKLTVDGIGIEAVPAYNTTSDRLQFHPQGRDNGYILTLGNVRIYIAGDTEVIPEMKDFKDIDIAFLPCNLPYTMTPVQLIEAAETIKPKVVYPYHYGTTDLSPITPALAKEGIYVRICPFDPE